MIRMNNGNSPLFPRSHIDGAFLRIMLGMCGFLLWIWGLSPLFAAEFYVNKSNGNDRNEGSQAQPFMTIARALRETDGLGGTINLDPSGGVYGEVVHIQKGGAKESPLILDGHGAVISLGADVTAGPWTKTEEGYRLERSVMFNPRWWLATVAFVNGLPLFTDDPRGENIKPRAWHGGVARYDKQHRLVLQFPRGLHPGNAVVVLPGGATGCQAEQIPYMACGLQLENANFVTIRNVTSAFSPNDGFNFHGNGKNVILERVKGLFNGDQGTSAHFGPHESYEVEILDSEFAFNGSGDAAIADHMGTVTTYRNVRVHQNRNHGIHFIPRPVKPGELAIDSAGRHVLENVVSFRNGLPNLPKPSEQITLINCRDLGSAGDDRNIPVVNNPHAPVPSTQSVDECDRLGRFLQIR